jgi:hypothetical protein
MEDTMTASHPASSATALQDHLRAQFNLAHQILDAIMADCSAEVARRAVAGGTIATIAPIYAHAVASEDMMVNRLARGEALVLSGNGWEAKTGIVMPNPALTPEWVASEFDLDALRAYASAVAQVTDNFLAGATEADMQREVDSPFGTKIPASQLLGSFGILHLGMHSGEIAALKGVHGLKGLPF